MKGILPPITIVGMLGFSVTVCGGEVLDVSVEINDGTYIMHGESLINAPPEFIFNILMDYENFHLISSGVSETRFLEPDEAGAVVGYTRIDSCVWFYCRKFEKVERIRSVHAIEITTEIIPEQSDFKMNNTRWTFEPVEGGTLTTYDAEMQPDFWVPPVIGPWAFKKKLRSSAEVIGERIEFLYQTGRPLSEFEN